MFKGLLFSVSVGKGPVPSAFRLFGFSHSGKSFVKNVPTPIEQPTPAFAAALASATAFLTSKESEKTMFSER